MNISPLPLGMALRTWESKTHEIIFYGPKHCVGIDLATPVISLCSRIFSPTNPPVAGHYDDIVEQFLS
jgi:hypothetical protein